MYYIGKDLTTFVKLTKRTQFNDQEYGVIPILFLYFQNVCKANVQMLHKHGLQLNETSLKEKEDKYIYILNINV